MKGTRFAEHQAPPRIREDQDQPAAVISPRTAKALIIMPVT
jgi:hypothetical protein